MTCATCRELMPAYLDDELLPAESEELRAHLGGCVQCRALHEEMSATSTLLQRELVRYPAPDILKARIRKALAEPEPLRASGAGRRAWWPMAAAAGLLVAVMSSAATWGVVHNGSAGTGVQDAVLSGHVRSLMPGHLVDVASTNQHNVKPWFNGRTNMSPPVPALDSAGFVLSGG